MQSDGKILAVGGTRFDASVEPAGLLRLNPDGTQDTSFTIGKGFVGQTLLIPGVFTNVSRPSSTRSYRRRQGSLSEASSRR